MKRIVIGIAGGTGSGKGAVAKFLREKDPENTLIIQQDSYYNPPADLNAEELAKFNYDHPNAIQFSLMSDHVRRLKRGETVRVPKYDFSTHKRMPLDQWDPPLEPKRYIIVEGILVLYALSKLCNLKLFVDTPDDERLARRILRDVRERGRTTESVIDQWRSTVRPMHKAFCEPSKEKASFIIPEGGENEDAYTSLNAVLSISRNMSEY